MWSCLSRLDRPRRSSDTRRSWACLPATAPRVESRIGFEKFVDRGNHVDAIFLSRPTEFDGPECFFDSARPCDLCGGGAAYEAAGNQSFDQVFSGKTLSLDYAYMQYGFSNGVTAIAGKFSAKNYLWSPTDVMWDTDINPEGASVKYAGSNAVGAFYAQGGVWVLSESKPDDNDAYLAYGQLGQTWKSDDLFGTVAATSYVFTDLKNTNSPFHRGGNTDTQMNSFNLATEIGTKLGAGTASLVGEFIDNYETSTSQDVAWSIGTKYLWDKWSMKYLYADLDANAVPDFLPDSDRFEGDTGVRGHEFELQYEIIKHVALGVDYYHMKRKADKVDENRVQADINVKF